MYPLAIREGVVYVWMGDDPWGEGAKDILPVPCTADDLDKNEVREPLPLSREVVEAFEG